MNMFALTSVLQVILLHSILGEDYCSRNDKVVQCVPCFQICPKPNRSCNISYFLCPNNCGSDCPDVCNYNCLEGRCEHAERKDLTCLGCKPEFTGKTCQELCGDNCYECNQFNSTCIRCKENYRLPNCIAMYETTSTKIIPTTGNCASKCKSCNKTSGTCSDCSEGYFGDSCDYVCNHCNRSLCAFDIKCLECISTLSVSECGTTRKEDKTTTSSSENSDSTDSDSDRTDSDSQVPNKNTHSGFEGTLKPMYGIVTAVVLTIGIICCWRKLGRRYQLKRIQIGAENHQVNSNQGSSNSLEANPGYIYIDDNDLDPYYSGLNENRTRPQRCHVRDHYERIGNQDAYQDVESVSSMSSTSETIFGNLFEIHAEYNDDNECSIAEDPLNQDDYAETYEMHSLSYLTPKLPLTRACSEIL